MLIPARSFRRAPAGLRRKASIRHAGFKSMSSLLKTRQIKPDGSGHGVQRSKADSGAFGTD
ncbi:hypothetical protein CA265_14985 [Sphingobacteriaceae bacterium GW460-11-11-14-LB5]|nr:hypothetical protein CA265_14985 [Sphingobacteriaceae bacterium GW460-11-11-14-LB5]